MATEYYHQQITEPSASASQAIHYLRTGVPRAYSVPKPHADDLTHFTLSIRPLPLVGTGLDGDQKGSKYNLQGPSH